MKVFRHPSRFDQPSLRRSLLGFLLMPMLGLLLLDALATYNVALRYANHVHDQDLSDDALTLARMLSNPQFGSTLTPQARFLLEYEPGDRNYFAVSGSRRGLLAGNPRLAQMAPPGSLPGAPVRYAGKLDQITLRVASVVTRAPGDASEVLTTTVAETLRDRRRQAREILWLATLMQALLIACVLALVWFGVRRGLRVLDPLTTRLAARTHELTPLGGADVPLEIVPLTRTIDALFERLRAMLALHDRFIADAAHQLRTPLAGLRLHAERAQADPRPETVSDALIHIQQLTQRATRTSTQLLALARAQMPASGDTGRHWIDLARIVPEAVAQRVHEALLAGVDLGYEGTQQTLGVVGDTAGVLDLVDNLIDNAIRYAGRGSTVTVKLQRRADGGADLAVEDDGPGVAPEWLPRLSERFFRVPGNPAEGSGLGLAIVQRIVERHRAELVYRAAPVHGLCALVRFPPAAPPV
jgi:two-component system, OmpR family, sensor histidine kinase TctE